MMTDFLSKDLVISILSRLPVKSAIRFRCVCKSWYTLLSNPKFIYKNLIFSYDDDVNIKNHRLFVKRLEKTSNDHVFSFLSYDDHKLDMSLTQNFPSSLRIYSKKRLDIVGSCDGLFCLSCYPFGCFLWNPAATYSDEMKLVKYVPRSITSGFGFGFDSKTNDHKIIRFLEKRDFTNYNPESLEYEVDIYSLRKDCWETLDVTLPIKLMYGSVPFNKFSSKNTSCHWAAKGKDGYPVVLSLDFSTETFRTTLLPDEFSVVNRNIHDFYSYNRDKLLMLKESNIGMVLPTREAENFYDIWVLLELGVKESWVKLFNIGPILGLKKPLAFWRNGDLFAETSNGQLLVYDPIEQEIKGAVQVDGLPGSIQIDTYLESQVSLEYWTGGQEFQDQSNS